MKGETNSTKANSSRTTKKQEKIIQENIEKMEKKIEESKKISSKYFEKIKSLVFINIIIAIVISIYFFVVNYLLIKLDINLNDKILKLTTLIIAILSVILFEISYKKDNGYIFLHASEAFIISFVNLYIVNLYKVDMSLYNIIILYFPLIIVIYYLIKALIIYIKIKKEDSKQKNDISEIVKKGK